MDDLAPYVDDFQEALSNLGKVVIRCVDMNLSLSLEKCEFLKKERVVLGIQVDPNKITIIKRVPSPQK